MVLFRILDNDKVILKKGVTSKILLAQNLSKIMGNGFVTQ
jgi:hypothetical protein